MAISKSWHATFSNFYMKHNVLPGKTKSLFVKRLWGILSFKKKILSRKMKQETMADYVQLVNCVIRIHAKGLLTY
jgi:hypothetical protein